MTDRLSRPMALFFLISLLFCSSRAFATNGVNLFGLGSKQAGTANSPTLFADPKNRIDPFLGHTVPSALAWTDEGNVAYSFLGAISDFKDTGTINIDASSDGSVDIPFENDRSFKPEMKDLLLHVLGIAVPIGKHPKIVLAITGSVPSNQLMHVDTASPFKPSYSIYETQANRPNFNFNLAYAPSDSLALSVGGKLVTTIRGATSIQLTTSGSGPTSSQRMEIKPKQKIAPIMSATYKLNDHHALALTFRYKAEWENSIDIFNTIQPANNILRMEAYSLLYFEPTETEANFTSKITDSLYLLGGLSYQIWTDYQTPRVHLKGYGASSPVILEFADIETRNTINPRLGFTYFLKNGWNVRGGVLYRQSPFKSLSSSHYNSVDTDTIVIAGAFGFDVGNPFKMAHPLELNFHTQVHQLKTRHATKDSAGTIGGPGYDVGGRVYSFGLMASTQF